MSEVLLGIPRPSSRYVCWVRVSLSCWGVLGSLVHSRTLMVALHLGHKSS
jgi:hypothetical protein